MDFIKRAAVNIGEGYKDILLSDFDGKRNVLPIHPSHFIPCNRWENSQGRIVDRSNGDQYCNDSKKIKRLKCLCLIAASPFVHLFGQILNIANRIAKLITFAHLWYPSNKEIIFKARVLEFAKDLLRIVLAPLLYLGLLLAAIFGIASPYDGGKIYATFERAAYGKHLLAPCFQPEARFHLFGGDINERNAW